MHTLFLFAVKVLEKKHIIHEKKQKYVMREKEVFSRINHPFFVKLYFTFQDVNRLCILTIALDEFEENMRGLSHMAWHHSLLCPPWDNISCL